MTNDQKKVVILYSVVCTISFVIVAILTINYVIGDQLLKSLGWKRADTEEIDDVHIPEFKSLAGVPIYIPSVENPELIDLIICAPLDNVTQSFLPESIITDDGNTLNETITTTENLPNLKTLKDLEVFIFIIFIIFIFSLWFSNVLKFILSIRVYLVLFIVIMKGQFINLEDL
jgi:hypothetical protein